MTDFLRGQIAFKRVAQCRCGSFDITENGRCPVCRRLYMVPTGLACRGCTRKDLTIADLTQTIVAQGRRIAALECTITTGDSAK